MANSWNWAENLCAAIVGKAARDYLELSRRILSGRSKKWMVNELEDIRDFFHSEYFKVLSELDGGKLEKRLAEEAMDEFK